MEKTFVLTEETMVNIFGIKLYRIKAIKTTKYAKEGDVGGWAESEETKTGDARISGDAWISGDAQIYGDARIYDDGKIESNNDYCCFQGFGSENRTTTFFKTETLNLIKVSCGCFTGTLIEFKSQVIETHADNVFAKAYLAIIAVVNIKFGLGG